MCRAKEYKGTSKLWKFKPVWTEMFIKICEEFH